MSDDFQDLHMFPLCNSLLKDMCVAPYYNSDSCGLSFHFCLKYSENEEIIISICNYIVDVLQSVYPFDRSFASTFSSCLLDKVKELPSLPKGPRVMVDILIEWISFATLIISFRTSVPADVKVRINSKDCIILCGMQQNISEDSIK